MATILQDFLEEEERRRLELRGWKKDRVGEERDKEDRRSPEK
jgi:hypothetical protein